MKKILLILFILSLLSVNVNAQETMGPDLTIESVKINPYPVEPGSEFEISVELRNSNNRRTIQDMKFSLEEAFPFAVLGDNIRRVNSLAPNERVTVTFDAKTNNNAISGSNDIKLIYEDDNGIKHLSNDISIDVIGNANDLSIVSIKTVPEQIRPGDDIKVVLALKNIVPVLMKEIDVNLDISAATIPFTPIGSTSKRTLNSLNKGDEKEFIFDFAVDADAEPKVYKIPLTINYKDEFNNNYSINTYTGLKVFTVPELKYSVESSEIHTNGKSGNVVIKVVNSGLSDIKFLSVELLESEDYEVISVSVVYLGNLESDDYETAEFNLYAKYGKDALPLKIKVNYKDIFNEDYNVERTLEIPLYSSSELSRFGLGTNGKIWMILLYAILVIFIYVFIVEWKKARNIPFALKRTVIALLTFIKRVIKSFRPRTLKRAIRSAINFFKEP